MLPEIIERIKAAFARFDTGAPISLGLKDYTFGIADNTEWYARNGFYGIAAALGTYGPSWAGETVTTQTALNHSVVWSCNSRISGSVGFMPLQMMQEQNGEKQPARKHPMYSALHDAPNDEMTAMDFRSSRQSHALLQGNAYAQIIRRSGTGVAVELQPLDPGQVRTDREKEGQRRLVYLVKDGNAAEKSYPVYRGKPQDILDVRGLGWDGLRGYSVIAMGRQSIGTALAAERNVAQFYARGGRLPYVLTHDKHFKNDLEFEDFRQKWEAVYREPHKAPILTDGLKYQPIGLSARDAQTIEWLQLTPSEICRWFDMSPHLAGDLSRATFSNIEHLAQEFVTLTLSKWIVAWEQALWRCVLTPEEKAAGFYFKHNVNALLRGDFKTRMEGYASALQNGHMNVDEVRDLEDRNPLPDGAGEDYHIQLNMQALPPAGETLTSQAAQLVKLGAQKKAANGFPHFSMPDRDAPIQ